MRNSGMMPKSMVCNREHVGGRNISRQVSVGFGHLWGTGGSAPSQDRPPPYRLSFPSVQSLSPSPPEDPHISDGLGGRIVLKCPVDRPRRRRLRFTRRIHGKHQDDQANRHPCMDSIKRTPEAVHPGSVVGQLRSLRGAHSEAAAHF